LFVSIGAKDIFMTISAKFTTKPPHVHIGILVFPGCVRSSAVVPQDVFNTANLLMRGRPMEQRVQFKPQWLSARDALVCSQQLHFEAAVFKNQALDALIVSGVEHASEQDLTTLLKNLGPEQQLIREIAARGIPVLFACSATCLVASAGVLNGKNATTSWWLAKYFQKHFPSVHLQAEDQLVEDQLLVSSAGITSYFDLSLWLVGRFAGDDIRQIAARMLLHNGRRESQTPYLVTAALEGRENAMIEKANRWLNRRLHRGWTVAELARHCCTSERTLLRRFKEMVGLSPLQYALLLRVERAKLLLESTPLSLADIAERCGYIDASSLQRVFTQVVRITPREYRSRFGLRR
jgi:transcriptional regulator GlxA family with amidase domain